jgi:hypothetical protein
MEVKQRLIGGLFEVSQGILERRDATPSFRVDLCTPGNRLSQLIDIVEVDSPF